MRSTKPRRVERRTDELEQIGHSWTLLANVIRMGWEHLQISCIHYGKRLGTPARAKRRCCALLIS